MVSLHGYPRECSLARTPKIACPEAVLAFIAKQHTATTERRQGTHPLIHEERRLPKQKLYTSHETEYTHFMQIMSALTTLSAAEECMTIHAKVVELLSKKHHISEERVEKEHPDLVKLGEQEIIQQLANLGLGSPEVPLDGNTISILLPKTSVQYLGERVEFKENHKLISILEWQSPLHPTNHFIYNATIPFNIFRVQRKDRKPGLHHSVMPMIDLPHHCDALNIRDVLAFYDTHLAVIPLKAMLEEKHVNPETATNEQLFEIFGKFDLLQTTLSEGESFTLSTGFDKRHASTSPEEILKYKPRASYEARSLTDKFFYCDLHGNLREIKVTENAPRQHLRAAASPNHRKIGIQHIRKDFLCGWGGEEDPSLRVAPEYRGTPHRPHPGG